MDLSKDPWRQKVILWLKENVSEHRLQHILGVEAVCIELAQLHKLPINKAAKAGLLHDLAKFFPGKKLLKIASKHQLEPDKICLNYPHLLHADISAILAREKFGIKDKKILRAIANHTLGQPDMDLLSCLVFVADAIEPSRGDSEDLSKIRIVSRKNLYQAVWKASDYGLGYLIRDRKVIHPRTVLTRNWALRKAKQQI